MELWKKRALYQALRAVSDNEHFRDRRYGICHAVHLAIQKQNPFLNWHDWHDIVKYLDKMWVKWPQFSGNIHCPIDGLLRPPSRAFIACTNMWNRWTVYGHRRWRLLYWLLDTLDDEIRLDSIKR